MSIKIEQLKLFFDVTTPDKNMKKTGFGKNPSTYMFNSVLVTPDRYMSNNLEAVTYYHTETGHDTETLLNADDLKNKLSIIRPDLSNISTYDLNNYPAPDKFIDPVKHLTISREKFKQDYKTLKAHVSDDPTKQFLQGIYLSPDNKMVTTNGFTLAFIDIDNQTPDNETDIIIPVETMNILHRIVSKDKSLKQNTYVNNNIWLSINSKQVKISIGNWIIVSRVIPGNFPHYKHVLPKITPHECIEFDAEYMSKELKKLEPMTKKCTNIVRFDGFNLSVQVPYTDEIKEKIKKDKTFKPPAPEFESMPVEIGNSIEKIVAFDIRFLQYCIKHMKGGIQLRGKDELSPWVMEHAGITQILMPIRTTSL